MFRDKGIIIGVLATLIIVVGGVFYFSGDTTTPSTNTAVSQEILTPKSAYQTSGILDGNYLDATPSAKVTLVEFGDFQCPACGQYHPLVKQLLTDFAGKINFVFRNFPLTQHANAQISAQAAEAAGLQGKYWQMYTKLYESQTEWSNSSDAKNIFIGYAGTLGLDINKYKIDIDSDVVKDKIKSDQNDGTLINLNATPTYYINGVKISTLPNNYTSFKSLIEAELAK